MRALLRFYSYLFAALLSVFVLGLWVVAASSGYPLGLGFLPWKGSALTNWLAGIGVVGLVSIFLAVSGRFRGLFFLWCLGVTGLLVWGFFLTPYAFTPELSFRTAAWITAGSVLAFIGAWPAGKKR